MTNWEKAKEGIAKLTAEEFMDNDSIICELIHQIRSEDDCKGRACEQCRAWLKEEYKPIIITAEEREYLKAVIKPFRDRVKYICKCSKVLNEYNNIAYLLVVSKDVAMECLTRGVLYTFESDKEYVGMQLDKDYTLEELGL